MGTHNKTSLALITNVLSIDHLPILEDWVEFVGNNLNELIVLTSSDDKILEALKEICNRENITLRWAGVAVVSKDWDEDGYLKKQLDITLSDYALIFKLDTIPFRRGRDDWFLDAINVMNKKKAFFITGTTQPYKADLEIDKTYLFTQRVSNNFLIIRPKDWLNLLGKYKEETKNRGRFATEARLEIHCKKTDSFGIRIRNVMDWRIFHTQLWDGRLMIARQRFKEGLDVSNYMKGFQDVLGDPWKSYYMHPVPSRLFRIRLSLKRLLKRNKRLIKMLLRNIKTKT